MTDVLRFAAPALVFFVGWIAERSNRAPSRGRAPAIAIVVAAVAPFFAPALPAFLVACAAVVATAAAGSQALARRDEALLGATRLSFGRHMAGRAARAE